MGGDEIRGREGRMAGRKGRRAGERIILKMRS